jgi:hypothetical protein
MSYSLKTPKKFPKHWGCTLIALLLAFGVFSKDNNTLFIAQNGLQLSGLDNIYVEPPTPPTQTFIYVNDNTVFYNDSHITVKVLYFSDTKSPFSDRKLLASVHDKKISTPKEKNVFKEFLSPFGKLPYNSRLFLFADCVATTTTTTQKTNKTKTVVKNHQYNTSLNLSATITYGKGISYTYHYKTPLGNLPMLSSYSSLPPPIG